MLTVYYFTSYARVYTASKLKKAVRTFLKYKEGRTELLHTHTRHRTWSCLDTHNLRYSNRARAFEYGTETAPGPTLDSQNCKQRFSRLATGREFMLGGNRTRGESRARQATALYTHEPRSTHAGERVQTSVSLTIAVSSLG